MSSLTSEVIREEEMGSLRVNPGKPLRRQDGTQKELINCSVLEKRRNCKQGFLPSKNTFTTHGTTKTQGGTPHLRAHLREWGKDMASCRVLLALDLFIS